MKYLSIFPILALMMFGGLPQPAEVRATGMGRSSLVGIRWTPAEKKVAYSISGFAVELPATAATGIDTMFGTPHCHVSGAGIANGRDVVFEADILLVDAAANTGSIRFTIAPRATPANPVYTSEVIPAVRVYFTQ